MSEFEIPFKSDLAPTLLTAESKLRFRCHKGISCFNACCKQADITLAPYDIIRLKQRLGMSSTEFLEKHTVPFEMDAHGIPGVKMRTDDNGVCLFMQEGEGCGVYEDRPSACRYYPVGLLSMKPTDQPEDVQHYFLVKEEHCKGHEEDREISVGEYRTEQGVEEFDQHNRGWYQLQLKKKSTGPAVGKPSPMSLQLYFMACYDQDRFRRFVASEAFSRSFRIDDQTSEQVQNDDLYALDFAYRFLRQVLFGEKTIDEQEGAWDQRVAERQEVWDLRRQAEIAEHEKNQEEAMRDAT